MKTKDLMYLYLHKQQVNGTVFSFNEHLLFWQIGFKMKFLLFLIIVYYFKWKNTSKRFKIFLIIHNCQLGKKNYHFTRKKKKIT